MPGKDIRISVRLSESSAQKLNEAKAKGYSTSQFINESLSKSVTTDLGLARKIMAHVCKMQTELEFEQDPEIKKIMREELNQICLSLNSSQSPM